MKYDAWSKMSQHLIAKVFNASCVHEMYSMVCHAHRRTQHASMKTMQACARESAVSVHQIAQLQSVQSLYIISFIIGMLTRNAHTYAMRARDNARQ